MISSERDSLSQFAPWKEAGWQSSPAVGPSWQDASDAGEASMSEVLTTLRPAATSEPSAVPDISDQDTLQAPIDFYNGLPEQFGPYELVRLLGSGGMAEVYEARKTSRHGVTTRVAVKRLHPRAVQDRSHVKMFIREAELYSRLQHPGLMQIHDFNEINGRYYIAMEMVDGCDLGELLGMMRSLRQPLPPSVVWAIMVQVLEALSYAHRLRDPRGRRLNLLHRDIKPSNILLSRSGQCKLGDFGLAKVQGTLYQTMTNTHVKGTLRYMSPEHVTLKPITQQSDLYALGVVLYEMLTLEPFIPPDASITSIVRIITQQPLEEILAAVSDDYGGFKLVLERALQREPIQRYGSADEILDDLNAMAGIIPSGPDLRQVLVGSWTQLQQWRKQLARQ